MKTAVIVGASHGGVQAAASLRQGGWDGAIRLISAEPHIPYHRPPLSKALLAGEKTPDRIALKGPSFFETQEIDLILDRRVDALDTRARRVVLDDGAALDWDKLILATGAAARRLPQVPDGLGNVFYLRDLDDALALQAAVDEAATVTILGAGFIGLEIAATAAKLGKAVAVIEAQGRVLARAVPPALSDFLASYHRARGVRLVTGRALVSVAGEGGRVRSVTLDDGETLPADLLVVGVGAVPETGLARRAGLPVNPVGMPVGPDGGVAPDIFAIGDCTVSEIPYAPGPMRLESVENALWQGTQAARACLGAAPEPRPAPWFWTDQYDLKIQIAGLPGAHDAQIARGDMDAGKFSLCEMRAGRASAVYSINRVGDHMAARKLITERAALDGALVADASVKLAQCVAGETAAAG